MDGRDRTMTYHHLRRALGQPGCALCRLRAGAGQRYVEDLLYEGVTDPDRRLAVRQALGFCRDHSQALLDATAALGVAIITQDILSTVLQTIESSGRQARQRRDQLAAGLSAEAGCPACAWADTMLTQYVAELVASIAAEDVLLSEYQASDGLCLPHFRHVLEGMPERKVFEVLISTQRRIWEGLVTELGEFIRKSDHRFRHEERGEESDSWQRAVSSLAGIPLHGG